MTSYLISFYADFDESEVQRELDAAEALATAKRRIRDNADREAREAEAEAQAIRAALDAYRAWQAIHHAADEIDHPADENPADPPAHAPEQPGAKSPTGRVSIAALVENGPDDAEWTISSMAEALGLGEEAHHAIGVSASRLSREWHGQRPRLARRRRGVYTKLPSGSVPAAPGEEREVSAESSGSQSGSGQAATDRLMV